MSTGLRESRTAMADIEFRCGTCGKDLVADEAGAGLTVNCPSCNSEIVIPQLSSWRTPNSRPGQSKEQSTHGCGEALLTLVVAVVGLVGGAACFYYLGTLKTSSRIEGAIVTTSVIWYGLATLGSKLVPQETLKPASEKSSSNVWKIIGWTLLLSGFVYLDRDFLKREFLPISENTSSFVGTEEAISRPQPTALATAVQRATQKPNSTDTDWLTDRKRRQYEKVKPLLDEFAYLEAGLKQGMSFSELAEERRKVEAEFIKLKATGKEDLLGKDYLLWPTDCDIPFDLREDFDNVRKSLELAQNTWQLVLKGKDDLRETLNSTIESALISLELAREGASRYFVNII